MLKPELFLVDFQSDYEKRYMNDTPQDEFNV